MPWSVRSAFAFVAVLLVATAPAVASAVQPVSFTTFELSSIPGTTCPGSAMCTNGAAEPQIRAAADGAFLRVFRKRVGSWH